MQVGGGEWTQPATLSYATDSLRNQVDLTRSKWKIFVIHLAAGHSSTKLSIEIDSQSHFTIESKFETLPHGSFFQI